MAIDTSNFEVAANIYHLPLALIDRDPAQQRQTWNDEETEQLACSIAVMGLQIAIKVRPIENEDGSVRFQIVMGERRYRAHQYVPTKDVRFQIDGKEYFFPKGERIVQSDTIKAEIDSAISDSLKPILTIIENEGRVQVTLVDRANAYYRVAVEHGYDRNGDPAVNTVAITTVANKVSKKPDEITDYILLTSYPDMFKSLVEKGTITWKMIRALNKLDQGERWKIIGRVTAGKLKVVDVEKTVEQILYQRDNPGSDQAAMFDVPSDSPETLAAHAQYSADMQTIATILARWGNPDGKELGKVACRLPIAQERDRIKAINASMKQLDQQLQDVQSRREAAKITTSGK